MVIKQVSAGIYDIFWDNGWDSWARIQDTKGFIKPIGGKPIPKVVFTQLIAEFGGKK